jgi:hypothetical protein
MAGVVWGPWGRELVGLLFMVAFIFCTGSCFVAISIGLNALSNHGACSVGFTAGTYISFETFFLMQHI